MSIPRAPPATSAVESAIDLNDPEPSCRTAAGYLLVVERPSDSASATHALRLALGRCRRGERVTVFLTAAIAPSATSDPVDSLAISLLQRLVLSGGQVMAEAALLGNAGFCGSVPGLVVAAEEDLAALLLQPGIEALWC